MNDARREQKALQQRAVAVIAPLLPNGAEQRVRTAFRQYNQTLRDHIRAETGLRLSDQTGRGSIAVDVVDGFPSRVAIIIEQHRDPMLWRLMMLQPTLSATAAGLEVLVQHGGELKRWLTPELAETAEPSLRESAVIVLALQKLEQVSALSKQIKEIHEDILGAYIVRGRGAPGIEIYWMAISLFAGVFGVAVEDLTAVTLAHELAHAYTHLGRDIDGKVWNGSFWQSDSGVVEGLAQFYTAAVTKKLQARAPSVFAAYEKLLEHQSGPYLIHREWLKDDMARGEAVRFSMLQGRNLGKVSVDRWLKLLSSVSGQLKNDDS